MKIELNINHDDAMRLWTSSTDWNASYADSWAQHIEDGRFEHMEKESDEEPSSHWKQAYWFKDDWTTVILFRSFLTAQGHPCEILWDLAEPGEYVVLTSYVRPTVTLYETNADTLVISLGDEAWSLDTITSVLDGRFGADSRAWINEDWKPAEESGLTRTTTEGLTAVAEYEYSVRLLVGTEQLGATARMYIGEQTVSRWAEFVKERDEREAMLAHEQARFRRSIEDYEKKNEGEQES